MSNILNLKKEKKLKKKKKSEELMPIAWHPERWWNFCMSGDEKKKKKKEIEPIFIESCFQCIQFESIQTFCHLKSF